MENGKLPEHYPLVLDQRIRAWDFSVRSGEHLDNKALGLVQAAGIILALVGVIKLQTYSGGITTAFVALAISFGAFAGLMVVVFLAWNPKRQPTPGTTEEGELFAKYLDVTSEQAFLQVLGGYTVVTDMQRAINRRKALLIRAGMLFFLVQIAGLLAVALLA